MTFGYVTAMTVGKDFSLYIAPIFFAGRGGVRGGTGKEKRGEEQQSGFHKKHLVVGLWRSMEERRRREETITLPKKVGSLQLKFSSISKKM